MQDVQCIAVLIENSKSAPPVFWSDLVPVRAWLNGNAMFHETFICFYVSEAKPLRFSLCSQMFDDVEWCWIYNIQNVCHANEQLSLCYFFSINVLKTLCYRSASALDPVTALLGVQHSIGPRVLYFTAPNLYYPEVYFCFITHLKKLQGSQHWP